MKCKKPLRIYRGSYDDIVPCGRCIFCRINKTTEWTIRLIHELSFHQKSAFITLTYDNKYLPPSGTLSKRDLQLYMKRLRKANTGTEIRFYASGEYGENYMRPHYHIIIFGIDKTNPWISSSWGKGFVHVGNVSVQSARYTAKYIQKKLYGKMADLYKELNIIPEFALMSRRPGIGFRVIEKNIKKFTSNGYVLLNGKKHSIPRYYTNHLSEEDKKIQKIINQEKGEFYRTKIGNVFKVTKVKSYTPEQLEQLEKNIEAQTNIKKGGLHG